MLSQKMAAALELLKKKGVIKTNAEFAAAVGMSGDRLKNILGSKIKKLSEKEALAAKLTYGIRIAWWTSDKAPMWLTAEEMQAAPDLHELQLVSSEVAQYELPEAQATVLQELLFLHRKRDSGGLRDALSRALVASDTSGFVFVPRYDVEASAGGGSDVHDEPLIDRLAFKLEWIQQTLGLDPARLALIDARGDSMSPTIEHGDLLLIDMRIGDAWSEGVYVINIKGALLVKRLRLRLSGMVEIISDNSAYGTEVISGEELGRLKIVGRVAWHGRKL